tara:strand:+ start:160 stop:420 length:261 start_codon:yes stop_codon:yes gene_type:complete
MKIEKINLIDWRNPQNGEERILITKLIINSQIKVCSEFHIKEFVKNKYIMACNHDNQIWIYFKIDLLTQEITKLDSKLISKLNPPR